VKFSFFCFIESFKNRSIIAEKKPAVKLPSAMRVPFSLKSRAYADELRKSCLEKERKFEKPLCNYLKKR
jgi:hypothetical protein